MLLVEDNADDILLFKRVFAKTAPDAVLFAVDGTDKAERYLEDSEGGHSGSRVPSPSLAILDVKMPGKGGLELLAWMRARESLRLMPVVMFSSSREPRDVIAAYRNGTNSYVVKPAGLDSLFITVRKILTYWLLLNRTPGKEAA